MNTEASLRPVIIGVAPNGARLQKADHQQVPVTSSEIIDCCAACVAEGATLLHVHVRDRNGRHVLDAEAARALSSSIAARVGDRAIVQTTTEAFGLYSGQEQIAFLKAAKPRAASLAWREIMRADVSDQDRNALLHWCAREEVALQYILYDRSDVRSLKAAISRGIVPVAHPDTLFVVGRYASDEASDASALVGFLSEDLRPSSWMACAFGLSGYDVLHAAVLMGGHIRIGFENGTHLQNGKIAGSNQEIVAAMRNSLAGLNRRPATMAERSALSASSSAASDLRTSSDSTCDAPRASPYR